MKKVFTTLIQASAFIFLLLTAAPGANAQTYCAASTTSSTIEWLANVTFAGIDNTSGGSNYTDYTAISGLVVPGSSYEFSGTIGLTGSDTETITVYIDWDQSFTFEASERYTIGTSCNSNGCVLTENIDVPATATPGETRMRVAMQYSTNGTDACNSFYYGEIEDYTINVSSGECTPPNFTYTIVNDCDAETYSVVADLTDFGSSTFITIYFDRSDDVPVSPATLIFGLEGQTVNLINDIPFGVTVSATISGSNPLCDLTRNWAQEYCHIDGEVCDAPITVSELPFNDSGNTSSYLDDYSASDVPPLADNAITNGTLGNYYLDGDDVVYAYTPESDGAIDITATGVDTYTGLFAFTGCPFDSTLGFHINYAAGNRSIPHMPVVGGTTYYIVISGWGAITQSTEYTLDITPWEDCEGVPSAGTVGDDMMVCAATSFDLVATGTTPDANGLIYTWQASEPGLNQWTDVDGANAVDYTLEGGVTEATDFRLKAYCTASDETSYSDVIAITLNPVYTECYCIPTYNSDCGVGDDLSNVSLTGESISLDNTTDCSEDGYGDFTEMPAVDLAPGETYSLSASTTYSSPTSEEVKAWIDYNLNGAFEENELIANTDGDGLPGGTGTFEFTVPEGLSAGDYRMRVRLVYGSSPFDACNNQSYGETQDYMVNIIQLSACSGTPEGGTATMDAMEVCGSIPFTLSVTGSSDPGDGLTKIWQSSPAGEDTWTDITGASSANYTVANGVNEPTDYRLKVTCAYSDETAYSNEIAVTLSPAYDCYCTPTYSTGCDVGDDLSNVTLEGESVAINNSTECLENYYGDFTDLPAADLAPGETYSLSASTTYSSPLYEQVKAWIDYNQNGAFEENELIANSNGNGLPGGTGTFEFTVPEGMDAGNYRLRVRLVYGSGVPTWDACNNQTYGETQDYTVSVIELNACSGTPEAGEAVNDAFPVCASIGFTLEVLGSSDPADGLSRIWQSSPAGEDNWTDIAGATSTNYTLAAGIEVPTDFRYHVTCANSDESDVSNTIQVSLKPATECYCTASSSTGTGYFISSVTTNNALQDLNNTSGFTEGGYADYTATDTLIAHADQEFDFSLNLGTYTTRVGIWVDFNQNGSFLDEGENIVLTTTYVSSLDGTMVIPSDLPDGSYRMRIRTVSGTPAPCGIQNYSEAEDYVLKVITLNECAGTPTAGTASDSFMICPTNGFSLTVTGATSPAEGLERIWQSSPAGENEWTDIAEATSTNYYVADGVSTPTDFRYRVTCANSDESDYSNVVEVSINTDVTECYCIPEGTNSGRYINNFSTTGGIENITNDSSGFSVGGYGDFTSMTVSQIQTQDVSFSETFVGGTAGFRIWVDWNQDGAFDPVTEVAYQSSGYSASHSGSFTVPQSALAGETRMRVVAHYLSTSGAVDPCATGFGNGEFEDYTFDVVALEGCSGMPEAGVADADNFEICANAPLTLSVTGASVPATGLVRNWEWSLAGADDWTAIDGATTPTYVLVDGISEATDFRYVVTCETSQETAVSNVISTMINTNVTECYCLPEGTNSSYYINNFSTTGGVSNIANSGSGFSAGGYGDFTSMTVSQVQTQDISFSEDFVGGTAGFRIWVDWNQDGVFDPVTEVAYQSSGYNASQSGSFTVPQSALAGETRMRVVGHYLSSTGSIDPCGSFQYGEFEDYTFEVIALEECTGMPEAGIADVDDFMICATAPITLSVSGSSDPASGLVSNWQSSPAGEDDWTDIDGATAPTYVLAGGISEATDFRYVVTCENSQETAVSNVISATINTNVSECYCIPEGTNANRYISSFVTTGGIQNVSNEESGFSTGGYGDFTAMIVQQAAEDSVNFTASFQGGTFGFRIWVDWNQDGAFDTETEVAYNSSGYSASHSGSFVVPADAMEGTTRMRIVANWSSTSGLVDPCATGFGSGEFEDYTFNVSAAQTEWDCPDLQANIGDACDDLNPDTENDMITEDCECVGTPIVVEFDCPELEANYGDACELADGMGEINFDCECVPVVIPTCNNFTYYLADHDAADGISDIYGVTLSGGVATMSYIATSDIEVHIAFSELENQLYAVSKHTNSYRTLDPFTGVWGTTVGLGADYGEITAAVFAPNGKLVFGSQNQDALFSVNVSTNVVSSYDTYSPVTGGDLAYASDGMLYLATRSGNGLYENYPAPVFDNLIGNVPVKVTGLAITDTDNLLVSAQGQTSLQLYNTSGSNIGSYTLELDGEVYTLRDGDMASGCNTGDEEIGDCDEFSTFYVDHGPGISGSNLYGVTFTSGGMANMTYLANVPYEAHIAFNAQANVVYLVNVDGSYVRSYDVSTDVFIGDLILVDDFVKITAAHYNADDGRLYIGDHSTDEIYSVDLSSGVATFYADGPVSGGDIVIDDFGIMYLATRMGAGLYDVVGGTANLIGSIGANVTGMALSNQAPNLILSNKNSGVFTKVSPIDASVVSTYTAMLAGSPFTMGDGDMASGCADEEATPPITQAPGSVEGMLTAYPNPTSGQAQVIFRTAETGRTLVEVYDMSGRNVATLFNAEANKGEEYRLNFDGAALPNGVYIYRMTTDSETIIEKFMIAK